jgi:thiol-disulfide isomerase/thioredoxin
VYRAWLDLARGGLPVEIHFQDGVADRPNDKAFQYAPTRIVKTTEIKKLANGGYFPATTLEEVFSIDPNAPQLSEADWKEVRDGKRKAPPNVVHVRHTWNCSVVDANVPAGDEFFVLTFPKGQKFFDLDMRKVFGALSMTPALKPGEPAAPLKIARWLDGKDHSLNEFRGKVVVLRFWGLSSRSCRESVPAYKALQEKYCNKPVVFIGVHWADREINDLADQIEKYARDQDWHYLAAIDAGTMVENSETLHSYGCAICPTEVIIEPDGRISYNGAIPPPELEGIIGKPCDEATPEDEAKMNAYMQAQFEEAGEKWPLDGMGEAEMKATMNRVRIFQLSRRIDAALKSGAR